MPCTRFEDLLIGYSELAEPERLAVDAHLAVCSACRGFLDALDDLDAHLGGLYTGIEAPAGFREAVLERARREPASRPPSRLPEILDLTGWGGVAVIAAVLSGQVSEAWQVAPLAAWIAGAAFALAALWMGWRSWAELKS